MHLLSVKQVLDAVTLGAIFYQHYDAVAILYLDIVRYSGGDKGEGMPPREVRLDREGVDRRPGRRWAVTRGGMRR